MEPSSGSGAQPVKVENDQKSLLERESSFPKQLV
jgi:hypothetical protein